LPLILLNQSKLKKKKNPEIESLTNTNPIHIVDNLEELFNKVSLVAHLPYSEMSKNQQALLEKTYRFDPLLANHQVLIVDDDIRNIFALSSALERHHMKVFFAENGRTGIEMLQKEPGIRIVLMDIMMPGMDGYETIQEIRKVEKFQHLPIIALTAKAMKDDRQRCLEAGANDYLTKPVDTEQLLSTLRVWLQYESTSIESEHVLSSVGA
jgi:CheY-like chemotaxis protein